MLHELLFALLGHAGEIITHRIGEGFFVREDFPYFHPSEVTLLNKIVSIGYHYFVVDAFTQKHRRLSSTNKNNNLSGGVNDGLYLRALCNGISNILDSYRAEIIEIEKKILEDPQTPLSFIFTTLADFQQIIPSINIQIIQKIQNSTLNYHGLQISSLLHNLIVTTSIPILRSTFSHLLSQTHKVLINQSTAWMIYGLLQDPFHEYFIQPNRSPSTPDTNFILRTEMIPDYIPLRIVEKILFSGCTVRILNQQHGIERSIQSTNTPSVSVSPQIGPRLLPQSDIQYFTKILQSLRDDAQWNPLEFECGIDKIHSRVGTHLWVLLVEVSGLPSLLCALKDYYFLARGEFWQCFLEESRGLMQTPPKNMSGEHDVNVALQQAALKSTARDDTDYFPRISLKLSETPSEGAFPQAYEPWRNLSLLFKVEWPIDLLLSPETLDKYNRLFQFLITVKRVQTELQRAWPPQMQGRQLSVNGRARLMPVWLLRRNMAFLIDNFQYYLMVDVLDTQFTLLQRKIQESKDFETVLQVHSEYLSTISNQTFIHSKAISNSIKNIFDLALQLCNIFSRGLDGIDLPLITDLQRSFSLQAGLFFTLLRSVSTHVESPHLTHLLLFLDYNKYFTIATQKFHIQEGSSRPQKLKMGEDKEKEKGKGKREGNIVIIGKPKPTDL